jgi:hypothetical protein
MFRLAKKKPLPMKPGDLLRIGDQLLEVYRFNFGFAQHIGTKKTMEDIVISEQNVQFPNLIASPLTLYGIFDG